MKRALATFVALLCTAELAAGSGVGHAGRMDRTAGDLVSSVLHMNTRQANKLVSKLGGIQVSQKEIMSLVMQGGLQFMHDITAMDETQKLKSFEKLERFSDVDGLSEPEKDLFSFVKSLGEYSRETKGTDEYPPKVLMGYLTDMMTEMGTSSHTVKQVEDALDDAIASFEIDQGPQTSFMEVEQWDEGGGALIPKKFASAIASFSQKLQANKALSMDRKDMLDGMAKKFTAGVLLASAAQQRAGDHVAAL